MNHGNILFRLLVLLAVQTVGAATVDDPWDHDSESGDQPRTLRWVIQDAAPNDTIDFSVNKVSIVLCAINIDKDLVIVGPPDGVTIDVPFGDSRVFIINPGISVIIKNVTFVGGVEGGIECNGGVGGGGAIMNQGSLKLYNCTFSGNRCYGDYDRRGGGAIQNQGTLIANSCMFMNNIAGPSSGGSGDPSGFGGAIANDGETSLVVVNGGTFSHNYALYRGFGGAVYNWRGTLVVRDSTFSDNHAGDHGLGGAIDNDNGTLAVNNSTFHTNDTLFGYGGAIYAIYAGSKMGITNSTFSGNKCLGGDSGDASDRPHGGGISVSPFGDFDLYNNIIAGNDAAVGPDVDGRVNHSSHNLIGKADDSFGWDVSDLRGTRSAPLDARLGPLRDNGGPTLTMMPDISSPAFDGGDDSVLSPPTFDNLTDQRGRPRKRRNHVDIGAVENGSIKLDMVSYADDGPGSLRQVIHDASPVESDTIVLDPSLTGVITLTSGELVLNKSLNIIGPGANLLTVSGSNATRVFHVMGCTNLIANLRIADGHTNGGGGGIAVEGGCLTLSNCTVANCYAAGTDAASQGGGAIAAVDSARLVVVGSTVCSNSTPYYGGGIYLFNGANASLVNSTVSGNRTLDGSNGDARGGGIFVQASTLNITSCTVANNLSATAGGGIYLDLNATGNLGNVLIAGNGAPLGPDCLGTFVSGGYNLIGNNSGCAGFDAAGDKLNLDPMIGPLADNGGTTLTHALAGLSPAIDQGKSFGLTTDQRGDPRPYDFSSIANGTNGDGADIGSFEAIPVGLPSYTIFELPGLGGIQTVPLAINSSGQIVGYSAAESGYQQAAFWTNGISPALGLGDLGGNLGQALGINDSGQIVGQTYGADGQRYATFWTNNASRPMDLGTFPGGGYSTASGINVDGQIVGAANGVPVDGSLYFDAAYWPDSSSGPLRLDQFFNHVYHANAISDGELIVGDALNLDEGTAGRWHAAFWEGACCPTVLTDLGGTSGAYAVNASGRIVGSAEDQDSLQKFAAVWDHGGGPMLLNSLGSLTSGGYHDAANGVNASGQIVGSSRLGFPSYQPHAALWLNLADPPIDLNDVIPSNSGWVLQYANAINDSGEIVGYGTVGGVISEQHAFALVPVVRALRVTSAARSGSDLRLNFASQIGGRYTVVTTSDLASGAWTTLQTGIVGNGGTVQITIPGAFVQAPPQQFFRVQQEH